MTINFDLDGTIVDLYGVDNWLDDLINEKTAPYEKALPLLRLATLARLLNNLQDKGYKIAIITWLCKNGTAEYDKAVTKAKKKWLQTHLPTVVWDEVHIVKYGTPKEKFCKTKKDILFDDEKLNRENWKGTAFNVDNILDILKTL